MTAEAQTIGFFQWPGTVPPIGTAIIQLEEAEIDFVDLWDDLWVKAPEPEPRVAPQAQALVRAIFEWTDWSHRKLARVLNSTHPTVSALEKGTSSGRTEDLLERLSEVHAVVQRVFLIANRDTSRVDDLMTSTPQSGPSAIDLLLERRPDEAYLAALHVNRPRRAGAMMRGRWPAVPGEATVAMDEDSGLYRST